MSRSRPNGDSGPSESQQTIGDADLEPLVQSIESPVILAFTAEWCGPCKWLDPYLEAVSTRAAGRVLIYRVDTDRSPGITRAYRVGSVPTVVLLRAGKELDRSVGVEPERLLAWADRLSEVLDDGSSLAGGADTSRGAR